MVSITQSKTDIQDKDYWSTPIEIYQGALAYFKDKKLLPYGVEYGLDVCASKHNTRNEVYISEQENALNVSWISRLYGGDIAWCNPPYSRGMKEQFIEKAITESALGLHTIMLLPNDTSTQWFSRCIKSALAVAFVCNGRIGFIHNGTGERANDNNAGSILVLFGPRNSNIARTFYVTKTKLEELGNAR